MILRVRRNFFEITTLPNSGIRTRFYALMLYAREEHKELWAIIVILLTIMSYFDSAVLLDEAARTNITRTLMRDWFYRRALHTGGWRVSVSPTLADSSVTTPGPC